MSRPREEENMRRFIRTSIATAALLVATPALSATLASGVLRATAGSQLICMVTNVGQTPLPADVYLLDAATGGVIAVGGDCYTGELAPWASCEMHTQVGVAKSGHCRVEAPGSKVRASLLVVNGAGVVTSSLPLTK
jgi:hypothetical protein